LYYSDNTGYTLSSYGNPLSAQFGYSP
jgi:hypothetical protein